MGATNAEVGTNIEDTMDMRVCDIAGLAASRESFQRLKEATFHNGPVTRRSVYLPSGSCAGAVIRALARSSAITSLNSSLKKNIVTDS